MMYTNIHTIDDLNNNLDRNIWKEAIQKELQTEKNKTLTCNHN